MVEKKKSFLSNITNAFTNNDEKVAAEKAAADKAAAAKAAATAAAKAASDRTVAAEKISREKASAAQVAANKAAADKAAAKASSERSAAMKVVQAKAILAKKAAEANAASAIEAARPKPGTVNVKSLRVRKDHSAESLVVAGLSFGEKVSILSIWTDGKNTWAQLGPDKWAVIKYDGEEMIKLG